MALGDRFLKKVTGKSSAAASDPAQIPSDSQLHSIVGAMPFPEPSSASSSDHYGQQNHPVHQQQYHHHQQQYQQQQQQHQQHQQQQQQQHQRSHAHNSRPPSSSSMKALSFPPATAPTSVAGSSSSAGSVVSKSASPPILMKGYLLVKKGLLKGYEKRFYFLTPRGPELFCFRDEMQFDEWMASGAPLRKHLTMEKSSSKDRDPTLVCSVLRADRAGDSGAFDRAIAVISGDDTKCTSTKYLAPTREVCEDWIVAFHRVQTARRTANTTAATTTASSVSSSGMENSTPMGGRTASVADPYEAHQHQNRSALAAKVSTPLSSRSSHHSDVAASPSQHSVNAYTPHHQHHPNHSTASVVSASSAVSTAPASGNVLLFVPASGSAISISDSKLQQAKKEMEELVAKGAKPPMRGGLDNIKGTKWRYGPPEYVLSDLEYVRGKTRDDESTPLESYAEMCCQTFLMEATHKAQYSEWTSVRQDYFYIRVNDGEKIPGYAIQENDLFGLLYLNDYEVDMDLRDGEERKDPRAILAEAFTQGFPMEVLDVYTQPPQCHFSWRHWGRFTGRYRGVRGNGELIEIRGFGHMHIDSGRLLSLQLFFKQRDLFDQLNKATASGVATNRTARFNTASSAKDAGVDIAPKSTTTKSPPVSATPTQQTQTPQQRPMRSDKLGTDGHIGDFTDMNISGPLNQPQPLTRSTTAPAARSHSAESSGTAHSGRSATGSHQPVNRTQFYQKFMPQAPGA